MTDIKVQLQENVSNLFSKASEGRYKSNEFRISELVSCPAKAFYYRKTGTRPKQNGKMYAGSLFHAQIPEIAKGISELETAEFEKECSRDYGEYSIAGHTDAVTADTTYEFKWTGTNLNLYPVPISYLSQVNTYATLFGKKKWAVVMVNSYDLNVSVEHGTQSDSAYERIRARAETIFETLKGEEPPEGPLEDWECRFCSLKGVCKWYMDKIGEKKDA